MAARNKTTGKTGGRGAAPNVVAQARGGARPRGSSSTASGSGRALWENFKSIAGALVIFLLIRAFLVEAYRIPSGSMIPTLQVGDWLFVNKLVYGPQIPFTHTRLPGYREPMRGDVVVFESPYQADLAAAGDDPTPTLVKRLIGMPGDTLYMRKGLVYVNGIPQRQGYAAAAVPRPGEAEATDPLMSWQHQYEVHGTRFGEPPATPLHDSWGPLLIPAQRYFMMGDNRYCSKDSRYWGLVPRGNVRGRPIFVYYSYKPSDPPDPCNGDVSDRPLSFITDIRWGRIGDVIH